MSLAQILNRLANEGVTVSAKLRLEGENPPSPETLELITAQRDELLVYLVQRNSVPHLPSQLERLIAAASSDILRLSLPGVPDTQRYVLAWACAYLTGDRDEALRRLWEAHGVWKGLN